MKSIIYILLLLPLFTFSQSFSSASEYMDALGSKYEQIKHDTWAYTRAAAHNKAGRKIEKKRIELLQTISTAKKEISKMPDYEGDLSYKDSVLNYLTMNYDILNNDYAKIVDMEAIAEQSYDLMEAYIKAQQLADERLKLAGINLVEGQKVFASHHNITLLEKEDETIKKLEQAGKVYNYYNKVYLIFFKCYKQEAYLLEAYSRADISAMEQNKNQLLEFSKNGLDSLNGVGGYKGDHDLVKTCKELLNFYLLEAKTESPKQIDFYIKKETFENVKKAFDSKSQEKKTQKDVDRYNSSLTAYNDGITTFNQVNEKLNAKRQNLFNKWNTEAQKFTSNHVQKR